jgi:hypothetical protein
MKFPTAEEMASALEALVQEAAKTVRAKVPADMARPANTARDGGDARGSGDAGSVGFTGRSGRDEAGSNSNSAVGVDGGKVDDGIGRRDGESRCGTVHGGVRGQGRGR